jgi:DNA primase
MITPNSIQKVRETARVEEVVGDFVRLKRRGAVLIGLCPFHNEKTPSFTVSPAKGLFKCFGCGKGGDSISFIMEHEHLSYVESIEHLAKRYGINIERNTNENTAQYNAEKQAQESLYIANNFAADFYEKNLFENEEGRSIGLSYFKERGFTESTIKKFKLGYALNKPDAFTNTATLNGYTIDVLKKLGLTNNYGKDFFKERVQFTIHNISGKIVAFAGRTLSNDKTQPKYINSPETEIYNKSKTLYGLYFAKNAIIKQDACYLVEGYTDVISMHQAGIENVVASSGTSLTAEQVKLIKRFSNNITILYDGDDAGIKAALRGSDMVLEEEMSLKVVLLPTQHDPDSYVQENGADAFQKYIQEKATDFLIFKTNQLSKNIDNDPFKKAELVKDLTSTIAKIPDALKRQFYIKQCAQMMQLDEQLVINEVNKQVREILKRQRKESTTFQPKNEQENEIIPDFVPPPIEKPISYYNDLKERDIIRLLIEFGDKMYDEKKNIAQYIITEFDENNLLFENNFFNLILEEIKQNIEKDISPLFFIRNNNVEIKQYAINLLTKPYEISENWWNKYEILVTKPEDNFKQYLQNALQHFFLHRYKQLIKENQLLIAQHKDNPEYFENALRVHVYLQERRVKLQQEMGITVS